MAGIKLENYAWGLLTASIVATDVAIPYATTTGTTLPSLASGEWFYALLQDVDGNREIIKVSSVSPTILLGVERAQEGTVARAWAAGARVSLALTKQSLMDFGDARFLKLEGGSLDGPLSLPAINVPSNSADNSAIARFGNLAVVSNHLVGEPSVGYNIRSGNAANTWRYGIASFASWVQYRNASFDFFFGNDVTPTAGNIITKKLGMRLSTADTENRLTIPAPDAGGGGGFILQAYSGNGDIQFRRGYGSTSQVFLQTTGGTAATPSTEVRVPLLLRIPASQRLDVGDVNSKQISVMNDGIYARSNDNGSGGWIALVTRNASGTPIQMECSTFTKVLYSANCNVESYQFQARDRIYLRGWDQPRITSGSGGFPADAREGDLHIWG